MQVSRIQGVAYTPKMANRSAQVSFGKKQVYNEDVYSGRKWTIGMGLVTAGLAASGLGVPAAAAALLTLSPLAGWKVNKWMDEKYNAKLEREAQVATTRPSSLEKKPSKTDAEKQYATSA